MLTKNVGFLLLGIGLIIVGILGLLGVAVPSVAMFVWMIITGAFICFGR